MNILVRERRFALFLLVCFFLVCGCGKPAVPMAPVSGTVMVGDQPVTSGQVSLIPSESTGPADVRTSLSAGTIDSSGKYTIYTDGKAGAPLGKYKVVVTPSMVPVKGETKAPPTPYNAKYSSRAKTDKEIEVVANAPAGTYDLKLTK